ncbi:MAG: NosD domain-containing protein [Promethearchaeota archaeon]
MHKRKAVLYLSSVVVFLLIVGMVGIEYDQAYSLIGSPGIQSVPVFKETQATSGPIYIDDNDDFRALGFQGEGTEEEPYVIENLVIETSINNLIHVRDTTAYFEIRDCELDGLTRDHYGILLWNVRNAKITSNVIQNCRDGIYLDTILDSFVSENTISNCLDRGVLLQDSSFNQVSSNLVTGCRMGFLLYNTLNISLSGNTFELLTYDPSINPSIFGFHLSWCTNTLLSKNKITIPISVSAGVHIAGFYLQYCSDGTLIENSIEIKVSLFGSGASHVYGFIMLTCDDNELTGNSVSLAFQGNVFGYYLGMHLEWSDHNTVSRNNISIFADDPPSDFEGFCIRLAECEDNTILENIVFIDATGHIVSGIYLHDSDSNSVYDNTVAGGQTGISLLNCEDNIVSGNIVDGCSVGSINLVDCIETTITDNIVMHSMVGIRLMYSDYSTVTDSTIWECDWGMYLDWSSHSFIFHNNFIDNLIQAIDLHSEYGNYWYHPELLEGNYWSDYTGVDDGSGTEKHAIAGDLIGDTEIPWPGEGFDYYPFVAPLNIGGLIENLIGEVQELIDFGVLDDGTGLSLIVKLEAALAKISQERYTAALQIIASFICQVNAFENTGILTDDEAQHLIYLANLVIELILQSIPQP